MWSDTDDDLVNKTLSCEDSSGAGNADWMQQDLQKVSAGDTFSVPSLGLPKPGKKRRSYAGKEAQRSTQPTTGPYPDGFLDKGKGQQHKSIKIVEEQEEVPTHKLKQQRASFKRQGKGLRRWSSTRCRAFSLPAAAGPPANEQLEHRAAGGLPGGDVRKASKSLQFLKEFGGFNSVVVSEGDLDENFKIEKPRIDSVERELKGVKDAQLMFDETVHEIRNMGKFFFWRLFFFPASYSCFLR